MGYRSGFIKSCVVFTVRLCIYLYLRYKVYSFPVKQTKSYSHNIKENNLRFPLEIITFCSWWPHCPPPHLHRSVTELPTSVFQFLWLPLTVFPAQRSLCPSVSQNRSRQWNLRRMFPICPQPTQAIALSLLCRQCSATHHYKSRFSVAVISDTLLIMRRLHAGFWTKMHTHHLYSLTKFPTNLHCSSLVIVIYKGESKSKDKIHLTALIEVTVSNFTYNFSTQSPCNTMHLLYRSTSFCIPAEKKLFGCSCGLVCVMLMADHNDLHQ